MDHTENIVEVSHVSFSYEAQDVLRDVSFNIHRGDYLWIVGANGSGKTTLLKIMLGILRPHAGLVKLFGADLEEFADRCKIGYVPQQATNVDVNFPATVREVVLMGRYACRGLLHRVTKEDREKVSRALEQVGLTDFADRMIGGLSGGQQQRVFIARALAGEPEIIFLDEPTVGVDTSAKNEFYTLLKKLNEDLHLTVVLITHDIENVSRGAMHVACLDRTLFFYTTLEEYLHKAHEEQHRMFHGTAEEHDHKDDTHNEHNHA